MLLQQFAFAIVEPLINKLLKYDHQAANKLPKLEGKSFAISLSDLKFQLKISVSQGQVGLSTNIEHSDCHVTTQVDQIKNMSQAAQITQLIKQDKLILEGDLQVAQQFSELLMNNNINWQSLLSQYIGDANAYRVQQLITKLANIINQQLNDASYALSTGLTDEMQVSVSSNQMQQFSDDVDQLSADIARFERTVKQLGQ